MNEDTQVLDRGQDNPDKRSRQGIIKNPINNKGNQGSKSVGDNSSVVTIYDIALQQETDNNRISTSSEDMADTSDEMIEQFNSAFNIPDQSRG